MGIIEFIFLVLVVSSLVVAFIWCLVNEQKRMRIEHIRRLRFFDDIHEQKLKMAQIVEAIAYLGVEIGELKNVKEEIF